MKLTFIHWRKILLLTLMVGFFALPGQANSVIVTPPRLQFTAGDGGFFEGQIEVYGAKDKDIFVKTFFLDWDFDRNGTVRFFSQPDQVERSATPWLRMEPKEFILPAGTKKLVTINGWVPMGTAPGDYWSMFFVEFQPYSVVQTSGVRISGRIGGSVTVTVPGPALCKGHIASLHINEVTNGEQKIEAQLSFVNEGDSVVEPFGYINIIDYHNKSHGQIEIPTFKVLPRSTRELQLPVELPLKPGAYVAIAVLDYGGETQTGYQKVFTVQ
ncbi:MAG TPA: hypothetical protein GXZ98_08445 [Firmicutes bacterium]|jgi:hypothetical protein|nr:hypothetical protein [Bacillota bacterium]